MIESIVSLLSKMPPSVISLIGEIVAAVADSKTSREAARRAAKVAAKKAILG